MNSLLVKIIASFLAALFSLFNIQADIPGFSKDVITATKIEYLNDTPGNADALITIVTSKDGEYKLYWANDDFEKLTVSVGEKEVEYSEFAKIETVFGQGKLDLPDFTAIPDGATNILVTRDDKTLEIYEIPEEKLLDRGESTYSYGVLSDLHFNRYETKDGSDVAEQTFTSSLNFFDSFDVSLVAMSGDISANAEKSAYVKFAEIADNYDFPVYTANGNHDLYSEYDPANWYTYMNKGVYGEEKAPGVLNVRDGGFDFVYEESNSGDIFVFLHQTHQRYGFVFNSILVKEQLDWLEEQFETYKDRNVYLFFHTFLSAPNGNPFMCNGNLQNKVGYAYQLQYTVGANDEKRFRNILREYDNVIFYSGHSHWAYHMQEFNPILNVTDYGEDGATYVHVSSVSSPRTIKPYQPTRTNNSGTLSEGYLATVYENSIVVTGVDFISGKLLAYATYEIAQ